MRHQVCHIFDVLVNVVVVLPQVRYLALDENCRVRRAGFAYRITYERFLGRYKMLSRSTWPNPRSGSAKDNAMRILEELGLASDCVQGRTKIFIRTPHTVFHLEEQRALRIPYIVTYLQKASATADANDAFLRRISR